MDNKLLELLVCPVTNASTDHHHQLHKHPGLPSDISDKDAKSCPALKDQIDNEENKALDEGICPVVGPVSTVLPPDHPKPSGCATGDGMQNRLPLTAQSPSESNAF